MTAPSGTRPAADGGLSRPAASDGGGTWSAVLRGRGAPAVLALLLSLGAPASGTAQEAAPEARRGGWIGVGLQEVRDCPRGADVLRGREADGCRRSWLVRAVLRGGPAERAGLEPGDTLLAVDGRPVTPAEGVSALGFRPGEPVELVVARDGGRDTMRVIPAPRPPERPTAVRMRRLPPVPELPDSARWAEMAERIEEMAPRLRHIQDSVLARAREHLRRMMEKEGRAGLLRQQREEVLAAGGLLRTAGAEFRPLTPELAEYFSGAEEGMLVLRVVPGTPAARLGLRPGDVVTEAAGEPVTSPSELRSVFVRYPERDSVVVKWIRKGQEMEAVLRRR